MTHDISDMTPICGRRESDLLLLLYGDLDERALRETDQHVRSCSACASSLTAMKQTLQEVDRARLREMATFDSPGSWLALRGALSAARRASPAPWWKGLARAAAVVLVAAASFAVGRLSDQAERSSPDGGPARDPRGEAAAPLDSAERVALFSRRTNDYLDRTRMVLLELTNGDMGTGGHSLSVASSTLLRENPAVRRVAQEVADRRLQELVDELETILGEIARLQDGNPPQADRIRTYVNNSGVLDQLEILSAQPHRLDSGRRRT